MRRREGQFTLLLDDQFDIIWHCDSLAPILGHADLVGHSATEHVHPDDLALVLETMFQANRDDDDVDRLDPAQSPESADIRVADADGVWHTFATTTYNHLDDPDVNAVLCTCVLVRDRSDVGRAIEMLGSGADVEAVLPIVARLADRSLGAHTRTAFAWRHGDRVQRVCAADETVLDPRLCRVVDLVWSLDLREPLIITDLDDPRLDGAGEVARDAGFIAAFLVPVEAPNGTGIIGAMVAWGRSTVEFQVARQSPVHVALSLAALAVADSRTKRDLRWAAAHDPLTGLINRAEFSHRLETTSAHGDVVLLYIDLDDFKPINDLYGHAVGDTVLIEVGRRISEVIGDADFVGRLGGDEFAVVCADTDDPAYGRDVANRIVRAVRQPIVSHGVEVQVGASVGVAVGAQPLIPSQLMQRADDALYLAKSSGKNTVRLAG
ncbi:MAG: diguanylate cyclase [Ilumatobacteraceae bacterium]|nr:diguanylate cyclase [Ilumatobacteraceae bacterium]